MYTVYADDHVQRDDGLIIPPDPDNVDWQAYQAWLADGNAVVPAPVPMPSSVGIVAESGQALTISQAKALVSAGRTEEALSAILDIIEGIVVP
jgi:hypothetical protein